MLPALLTAALGIIEKVIPDPAQAAKAKLDTLELAQRGELAHLDADVKLALGQLEVNRAEAATDAFRGGWRPMVGWVCAAGLGYQYIARPLLPWFVAVLGLDVPPLPPLDMGDLITILAGMLGLGGLRSWERTRGVIPPGR